MLSLKMSIHKTRKLSLKMKWQVKITQMQGTMLENRRCTLLGK